MDGVDDLALVESVPGHQFGPRNGRRAAGVVLARGDGAEGMRVVDEPEILASPSDLVLAGLCSPDVADARSGGLCRLRVHMLDTFFCLVGRRDRARWIRRPCRG